MLIWREVSLCQRLTSLLTPCSIRNRGKKRGAVMLDLTDVFVVIMDGLDDGAFRLAKGDYDCHDRTYSS